MKALKLAGKLRVSIDTLKGHTHYKNNGSLQPERMWSWYAITQKEFDSKDASEQSDWRLIDWE